MYKIIIFIIHILNTSNYTFILKIILYNFLIIQQLFTFIFVVNICSKNDICSHSKLPIVWTFKPANFTFIFVTYVSIKFNLSGDNFGRRIGAMYHICKGMAYHHFWIRVHLVLCHCSYFMTTWTLYSFKFETDVIWVHAWVDVCRWKLLDKRWSRPGTRLGSGHGRHELEVSSDFYQEN